MSRRLRIISKISRCRFAGDCSPCRRSTRARRRSAAGARHAARAGHLVRGRWLGGRRSRRRLRRLPHQLQSIPGASRTQSRQPADPPRPARGLPARRSGRRARKRQGQGARVLRGELPAGADRQARRKNRPADRLLRADRRRLALPESGILGAALPAPERHPGRRQEGAQDGASQPGEHRPLQRQEAGRALFRSPRHRERRARRAAARDRLDQGSLGGDDHPDPGLGAGAARRRHHAPASTTTPTTATPTRRSDAS